MPIRHFSAETIYRYGFNGKENDNEVKGEGNQQDYGMRIYDPRVGRFLSVDPLTKEYPMLTPYQFAGNRPIDGIDLDGKEWTRSTTDTKINETTINRVTQLYVKVKVVNQSNIVKDPKTIEQYAKAFKTELESSFSGKNSYVENGITINEQIKTEVILDFTPEPPAELIKVKNPDGTEKIVPSTPNYARLIFDDRTSTTDENGVIHSTPGVTTNKINVFTIRIGVTMDNKAVLISDFKATAKHEGGHSGGLNHPWELNSEEKSLLSELDQLNPGTSNRKEILKNFMNSNENPDPNYNNSSGNKILPNQLRVLSERVRDKSRFTLEQLKN